eukprot:13899-Heterococcus_DN1.PRE.1
MACTIENACGCSWLFFDALVIDTSTALKICSAQTLLQCGRFVCWQLDSVTLQLGADEHHCYCCCCCCRYKSADVGTELAAAGGKPWYQSNPDCNSNITSSMPSQCNTTSQQQPYQSQLQSI